MEALNQIEAEKAATVADAIKNDKLKWQKEDNVRKVAFFKCTQRVAKHFNDLQIKAQKQAKMEPCNQEKEAAKAAKAAEKVAAKEAEHKQKAQAKAEKAVLDAATKGHKEATSRGKRKAVSDNKENRAQNQDTPSIQNPSPK
ncbi:hypothetical protein BS47DRAFT_1391047 [Hydnum rufescens UP504]|uniref:Uncharacterized protein n=1 Tax=Hydnum rufescens UP504 TaxID=1448309 RepID=A0A9P6B1X1_9AGAM|nr:hypothetical protein BS47DRAFT_1391047 [Hydnum rufescens UP504]